MKQYPKLLTVKSTRDINRTAAKLARAAGRNRSEYIRQLIRTLDQRPDVRQAVNEAIMDQLPQVK